MTNILCAVLLVQRTCDFRNELKYTAQWCVRHSLENKQIAELTNCEIYPAYWAEASVISLQIDRAQGTTLNISLLLHIVYGKLPLPFIDVEYDSTIFGHKSVLGTRNFCLEKNLKVVSFKLI